jgi:TolB-like protein/class 3 adenylate cyclase
VLAHRLRSNVGTRTKSGGAGILELNNSEAHWNPGLSRARLSRTSSNRRPKNSLPVQSGKRKTPRGNRNLLCLLPKSMPSQQATDPKFDIGHVLFVDIVGYSKLLINDQGEAIRQLSDIVSGSEQFRAAEAEGKLVRLPTGDGMALVFRTSPETPVQCAIEIAEALKNRPQLKLRMGIHSGPVNEVVDVNNQANLAGAGINVAQRVMDCGDAGHILLSKHVAEDLEGYARWHRYVHDLGDCEVKHGVRLSLANLYSETIGNPQVPDKIKQARRALAARRRRERVVVPAAILALMGLGLSFWLIHQRRIQERLRAFATIPVKSIAVLPFENLSANPENAFFADGVQDEILTNLARIADLKVISRTSVMQYKTGIARNVRAIGQALGVAHLLEGSVQRAQDKLRINAQLIDARNDAHLWAQTYDRDVADVFAIQSEIAKTIADQLQARLSPAEKAEIERRPTSDDAAFALYTQGKTLLVSALSTDPDKATFLHAVGLLDQAVARDPDFFSAYCELVHANAELYFYNFDHMLARLALAEAALQNAVRLRPEAGETHLAEAEYLYRCHLKYDRARAELALAARVLPNNSRVYALTGFIDRRQGRWEEAIRNFEKALEVDPRNYIVLQQISASYPYLRRHREEALAADRILALNPKDAGARVSRAFVDLEWHADLQPYHDVVHAILLENPDGAEEISQDWFAVSWYERNGAEATRAAGAIPAEGIGSNAVRFPKAWYEGLAARLRDDTAAAHETFLRARAVAEHDVQERPEYGPPLCVLGMIDAMLDRKEDAIREGRRAVDLLPVERDSINGSHLLMHLAMIYAATGENDLAIAQLNTLLSKPGDGSYGDFRLNPFWDPLRDDPRFEKLVASLAPKD